MDQADLFSPARMPLRDANGFASHPDLDDPRWREHPVLGDEYLDTTALEAAGFEHASVEMEYDTVDDDPARIRYFSGDSADVHDWEPSVPPGAGWVRVSIHDTEDGPMALYVRRVKGPRPRAATPPTPA